MHAAAIEVVSEATNSLADLLEPGYWDTSYLNLFDLAADEGNEEEAAESVPIADVVQPAQEDADDLHVVHSQEAMVEVRRSSSSNRESVRALPAAALPLFSVEDYEMAWLSNYSRGLDKDLDSDGDLCAEVAPLLAPSPSLATIVEVFSQETGLAAPVAEEVTQDENLELSPVLPGGSVDDESDSESSSDGCSSLFSETTDVSPPQLPGTALTELTEEDQDDGETEGCTSSEDCLSYTGLGLTADPSVDAASALPLVLLALRCPDRALTS